MKCNFFKFQFWTKIMAVAIVFSFSSPGQVISAQGSGCKSLQFILIPQSGNCCYKLGVNNSNPDNCFQQVNLNLNPDLFINFNGVAGWRANEVSPSEYNIRPFTGFIPFGYSDMATFCVQGNPSAQMVVQWDHLCLMEGCDTTINLAGCQPVGQIEGYVYADIGCEGKAYTGKNGLEDWTVEVYDNNGDLLAADLTDNMGYYKFSDLPQGNYIVKEIQKRPPWTPVIPISGQLNILVEKDKTSRADFGNCYEACSCDSIYTYLEQVEDLRADTSLFYLNIYNRENHCFNEMEIMVDSSHIVKVEILLNGWVFQQLSTNKVVLYPPNGLVPTKISTPALFYILNEKEINITINIKNKAKIDLYECKRKFPFNPITVKPRPNCCPENASIPGPNISVDPNFTSNTPLFSFSPNYIYKTTQPFNPGNLAIGDGIKANQLNPSFFPYHGKSGLPGDKYLIIDASPSNPGYVWKQSHSLNPGELYTFCAHFKNLLPPGQNPSNPTNPFVELRVYKSGILKAQSGIYQIKEGDPWIRVSLSVLAAGGGTYDFEIWSLSQVVNGNDFGVDEVTIQSCQSVEECCASMDTFCARIERMITNDIDESNCKLTLNIGNLPPCDSIMILNWGDNQAGGIYHGANSMIMHSYNGSGVYYLQYVALEWDFTVDPPQICNEKVITDTIVMTCGRCVCPSPAYFSNNLIPEGNFSSNSINWFTNNLLSYTNSYSGPGSNEYTITANTHNFDTSLNHCGDHTPGNNMLVASFNTAAVDLVERTINVNPNTTYFIEYYVMTPSNTPFTTGVLNLNNVQNISLIGQSGIINGNCEWQKICFRWFSGTNTQLHFIIGVTNNTSPANTDVKVALDDISIRGCGFSKDSCVCPVSPHFLDMDINGTITTLISLPHGVQTPAVQCTNSNIVISGFYGCTSSNPNQPCPETEVNYRITTPNNTTLTSGTTTNYLSIILQGSTVSQPGTYKIRLATKCPGVMDSCIHEFDWIVKCDSCKCNITKDWFLANGTTVVPVGSWWNNPLPIHIGCVKYDNSLAIFGEIHCDPDSCSKEDSLHWTLIGPSPNDILQGIGITSGSFGFNLSIPWTAFDVSGGAYTLTIHKNCGTMNCDHSIQFIVDSCPCVCDSLKTVVSLGFDVTGSKSSCKRKFKPFSLCKSDYVEWTINGVYNPFNATSGNNPFEFVFPNSGTYTVCMIVNRRDPFSASIICKDTVCRKVYIDCDTNNPWTGLFCTSNLVLNGNFELGAPGTVIMKNGINTTEIDNWSLFPNPGNGIVVADTGRGSFDTRAMTFIGNQNNFAGIAMWPPTWRDVLRVKSKKLSFQYQNYSPKNIPTLLQFRLQRDSSLKDPINDYSFFEYSIPPGGTNNWNTVDTLIELDPEKIKSDTNYLIICLQNNDTTEYSIVSIDNIEICDESHIRLGTDDTRKQKFPVYLYPNPANEGLLIRWPDLSEKVKRIELRDINNKLVMTKEIQQNSNEVKLEISKLISGMYFVSIYSDQRFLYTDKFIKY